MHACMRACMHACMDVCMYVCMFTNHCLFEMNIQGSSVKAKSHRSRGIGSVLPAAGGYRCLCHWKTGAAVDPAAFGHWLVSQGL